MPRDVYAEIAKLRAKHPKSGRSKAPRVRANFPDLRVADPAPLSNTFSNGGFKRDKTTEHRWKRGCEETQATIQEIENKAKRIRPKFSKGAYEYATDGDNTGPLTIYRKGG